MLYKYLSYLLLCLGNCDQKKTKESCTCSVQMQFLPNFYEINGTGLRMQLSGRTLTGPYKASGFNPQHPKIIIIMMKFTSVCTLYNDQSR